MRFLYTLLFALVLPFMLIRLWLKGRKNPAYRSQHLLERFGVIPEADLDTNLTPCIWVHAVSVGEVEASTALVRKLLSDRPELKIMLTTTTPTGRATARSRFADLIEVGQLQQSFIPYDLPYFLRRFLHRFPAEMVIIMETEIWPNLLHVCEQKFIPVVLANARLAERSQERYARWGKFTQQVLNRFSAIITQTTLDQTRFAELGVDENLLHVGGNLKCDHAGGEIPQDDISSLRATWGQLRPIWIAGSTHEGEELQLLEAHKQILRQHMNCLFVIVPRHPERFDDVYELCQSFGLKTVRHSRAEKEQPTGAQVYLIDTMGELLKAYAASDICFVAGTLMPIGGHNILEPAIFSKPILVGQKTFKIEHLMSVFKENNAIVEVQDQQTLADQIIGLISDPQKADELGERAHKILRENRGASERHLTIIKTLHL